MQHKILFTNFIWKFFDFILHLVFSLNFQLYFFIYGMKDVLLKLRFK